MSDPHAWTLVQEPDSYSRAKSLILAAVTMAVILAVIVLCALLMEGKVSSLRVSSRALTAPTVRTPREIGGVKQTLIDVDDYGRRLEAAQRQELERYRWTDRGRGVVSIPIEEGMRLIIEKGGQ